MVAEVLFAFEFVMPIVFTLGQPLDFLFVLRSDVVDFPRRPGPGLWIAHIVDTVCRDQNV